MLRLRSVPASGAAPDRRCVTTTQTRSRSERPVRGSPVAAAVHGRNPVFEQGGKRAQADRDPRRRYRRDDGRQPAAAAARVGRAEIDVVDRDDAHVYQPGLLFVPFGLAEPDELVRSRRRQLHRGIEFHQAEIDASTSSATQRACSPTARRFAYDVLVVASGARLLPEETEGMTGAGWRERVFTFYDRRGRDGAARRARAASTAAASSSTSSTCRSSARSRRSSSPSSPTGTCASAAIREQIELALRDAARRLPSRSPSRRKQLTRPARGEGHRARDRVQRRRGRRRRRRAHLLRRPRDRRSTCS